MTDVINQNVVVDRDHEARKLFGFAVAHDPAQLYEDLGQPRTHELPGTARTHLMAEYGEKTGEKSELGYLLLYGIGQVSMYVSETMAHHPGIPIERAIAIARHQRTLDGLAIMAKQKPERSWQLFDRPGEIYRLSPDEQAIEVDQSVDVSNNRGCPAIEMNDGVLTPWPIFNRFAPWAGELAVHAFYKHPWVQ
jgi:hypothetical protein